MKVHVASKQTAFPLSPASVRQVVKAVLAYENVTTEEVGVYFVSTEKICALHDEFFNDPTPTDCITFPIDEAFLGEIFICPETALNYVKNSGGDKYQETTLYLIHGLLHLLGFDDLDPKEKRKMRAREKLHMEQLLKKRGILHA